MGGGSYSYSRASVTSQSYVSQSRETVFHNRRMPKDMDPKGLVFRESCDSDEHPESFPIIIGLDITGSMGHVPETLIKNDFKEIMKGIMESGIKHPQVLFCGFGDHLCDNAPFQVGQFESSDTLLDHWLKSIYLEGGGGGNGQEDNLIPWYLGAYHTKTDSMICRDKRGVLITIGDDGIQRNISSSEITSIFGSNVSEKPSLTAKEIYQEASKKWDIWHINLCYGRSSSYHSREYDIYKELGFDMSKFLEMSHDASGIKDTITKIILDSWSSEGQNCLETSDMESDLKPLSHPLL